MSDRRPQTTLRVLTPATPPGQRENMSERQEQKQEANETFASVKGEGGSIRYAMETVCFFAAIQDAWCRETSSEPDVWSDDSPSLGQCAITALVVQDGLGGELLRGTVRGISHYWNLLDGGGEVDLTRGQFGEGSIPDAAPIIRDREYVEASPETMARYRLLRERMGL